MPVFLACSESDLGQYAALMCNTTFRFEHGLHGFIGFEQYTWGCRVRIPYDRNCPTSVTRRSEGREVEHDIRAQATSIVNSKNGSAGLGRGSPTVVHQSIRRIGQGPLGLLSARARERERPSQVDLVEPDVYHQSRAHTIKHNTCPAGEFAKGDPNQPDLIIGCEHCPAGRYSDLPAATVHFVSHFADVCLVWFCAAQRAMAYDVVVCMMCTRTDVFRVSSRIYKR